MKDIGAKKRISGSSEVSCRPAKRSAVQITPLAKLAVGPATASAKQASADEIPVSVWGHVMDYLPYTDVLKCLVVNRLLSFEAPSFVDELHIFKSCEVQLYPLFRTRRRFENVSELNIFCLLDEVPHSESRDKTQKLNLDTVDRLVPFLECFPKLKFCFCGGWDSKSFEEVCFNMYECTGPEDHVDHYRQLLRQFSSAFEKGSLPRSLELASVLEATDSPMTCGEVGTNNECSFCSRICCTFPLNCLLGLYREFDHLCVDNCTLMKRIRDRKWSRKCFEAASTEFCGTAIGLRRVAANQVSRKELVKRKALDPNHIYFLSKVQLERIKFMVDLGIDIGTWGETPEDATKEHLLEKMKGIFPLSHWGFALTKSTFDIMVQVGYPFEKADFVLVDELSDPLVKGLNFVDIHPPTNEGGEENDSEA